MSFGENTLHLVAIKQVHPNIMWFYSARKNVARHVHFVWLAAKLAAQAGFWQPRPLRCIYAAHVRRQNAYATLALAIFCGPPRRVEIAQCTKL
jgi:hypothetical protein